MSLKNQEEQESHKPQKNEIQEGWNNLPEGFSYQYLNPEVTSTEQFLAWLDEYAITHSAVNHHLLQNFYQGVYGKNNVRILLRFLNAYKVFNINFLFYVKRYGTLMSENVNLVDLLEISEEEVNVDYDNKKTIQCLSESFNKFGIQSECVHKIPYTVLFERITQTLEVHFRNEDRISYQKERDILMQDKEFLQNLSEPLLVLTNVFNTNFDSDENKKSVQRISAIYWGSEHIVTKLYPMIYQALQQHTNLSPRDLVFFPLRIHCAKQNSTAIRNMLLKLATTSRNRKLMAKFAFKCLNGRVDFYEKFLASIHQNILFKPLNNKEEKEEEENKTPKP